VTYQVKIHVDSCGISTSCKPQQTARWRGLRLTLCPQKAKWIFTI